MLARLSIRDIVLIDRLELELAPGLCVFTGETGAGKSILLDSLGLALGRRAEAGLVRAGAKRASAIAVFATPSGAVAEWLAEHDLAAGDELVLRRTVGADGRSRAFVNDAPVTVGALAELGSLLVEVYGQHDRLGLMDPATHRAALDAFAGLAGEVQETASAHAAWRRADVALAAAESEAAATLSAGEALADELERLDRLAPQAGEEAALAEERGLRMAAEGIGAALAEAAAAMAGDRHSVEQALALARRAVERVRAAAAGRLDATAEALERALIETTEASALLDSAGALLEAGPGRLETIEERLFALRAAARHHRCAVDDLPALRAGLGEQLAALDAGDAKLSDLRASAAAARVAFVAAARRLGQSRARSAGRLDAAVQEELGCLRLAKAGFATVLEPLEEARWGATGAERVAFRVATNPGQPAGPLNTIASGGELSRFMLALCAALAATTGTASLVFDEIDSGVGGAVADAVGQRLARLAEPAQVLVVTHQPQVAALADRHFLVSKDIGHGTATTRVEALAPAASREEIARMLAGAEVTERARAAADSLIEARRRRAKAS